MRILLINPNTSSRMTDTLAALARAVAGDATFVPVTARFGAHYISSRAAALVAGHAALDALAEHIDGCDAAFLACFGDPGLAALRELSPVPVVSMAEASCLEACRLGARFAIVTGGALWEPLLREYVAALGLANRLAGIRVVAATGDVIARDPDAALGEIRAAVTNAVTMDGADVVILGGAGLAGIAARLQPETSVPLICSVEAGTKAAVEAARSATHERGAPALSSEGLSPALTALLAGRGKASD